MNKKLHMLQVCELISRFAVEKKLFTAALVVVFHLGSFSRAGAQVYWQRVGLSDSDVTSLNINAIGQMVAAVDAARLYVATDSGTSWTNIPGPNLNLSLTALDNSGRIYVGDLDAIGNGLQRSTDNGAHWKSITDSTGSVNTGCYSIGIAPFGDVFATFGIVSSSPLLYHSTDHGDTWRIDTVQFSVESVPASTPPVYVFDDRNNVYAIGRSGFVDGIFQSGDSGVTWLEKVSGLPAMFIKTLCVDSGSTLFLSGNYISGTGSAYGSTNSGESWEACDTTGLPAFASFQQLTADVKNNLYGIVGGSLADGVYRSTNGGHSWSNVMAGLDSAGFLYALAAAPSGAIYCATQMGVYKSTSTLTAVGRGHSLPLKFSLGQNFPNPFNPRAVIQYSLPKSAYVTLKVYDVLGREVATLLNGWQPPGDRSVKFDGSGLPSGVYVYRMTVEQFTTARKMILLK